MNCPRCNCELSPNAKFCAGCGIHLFPPNDPPPKRQWGLLKTALVGWACLMALVFLALIFSVALQSGPPKTSPVKSDSPSASSLTHSDVGPSPTTLSPENSREGLKVSYKLMIESANPHLNFIEIKYTKVKGGYTLWAVHTYFNQYSFDIGPLAKDVSSWMNENRNDLRRAGIVRVGVKDDQSYGGAAWFDLK